MIVIGLSGLARSGKDSVADILVRDYGFEKRSFAGPIKEMLRKLDPMLGYGKFASGTRHELRLSELVDDGWTDDDIKESDFGPEYRRLLQALGTDCIRSIDDDFWIRAARNSLTDEHGKYVFTDVRFPNEAQMIYDIDWHTTKSVGNYNRRDIADVWHVTRPGIELPDGAHVSEQWAGRMGETVEIINNANLDLLKGPVDIAMEFLHTRRRMMRGDVVWEMEQASDAEWMKREDP